MCKNLLKSFFLFTVLGVLCGCSSIIDSRKQKHELTTAYKTGNIQKAHKLVSEESEDHEDTGDSIMWLLESGLIKFDSGDFQNSLKAFEDAEEKINAHDERATVNARASGAETGSAITNPTAIPYKGMYCDRILLNVYKSLVYMALGNIDAAKVELRRMRDVQKRVGRQFSDEIERERKITETANRKNNSQTRKLSHSRRNNSVNFKMLLKNNTIKRAYVSSARKSEKAYGNFMNPFSTYMSAIGYLMENNYNEACVDFRNLYRMNKDNLLTKRDFVTCARKIGARLPSELKEIPSWDYTLNRNIVFVIFANGHAPALKQMKIQLVLPYVGYTGIAFPQYEYFKRSFRNVCLSSDDKSYRTIQLADMDAILAQEYHKRLPTMITRLAISYLVKETASLVAVQAAKRHSSEAAMLAYATTGLYKYLFNTADTRCWETLPGEYQMVHFPIPDDRKLKVVLPGAISGKEIFIHLKKESQIVIVYIRGIDKQILSLNTFEFY